MVITRTPFRMSFAGGGTDMPGFYRADEGAVTATAINKYMYIIVNKRFDRSIRVSYSRTEIVNTVHEIQHPIVREAMKLTGVTEQVEIVSIADIPAQTGLGSSSSFTVGLLNALYAYRGVLRSAEELAREACTLELDVLDEPIGKQDQYLAAYGNLRHIRFHPNDAVSVEYVLMPADLREAFQERLLLMYMGRTEAASTVLRDQQNRTEQNRPALRAMHDLAVQCRDALAGGRLDDVGDLLHEGWEMKKRLADGISDETIDGWYETARKLGARGGKVLGAGGRGFLLLYCPPEHRKRVLAGLSQLVHTPFAFEPDGTRVIYVGG
ncbi:MAG: GHMP kinase [Dehalococcoidia bacterium]|nr:GHMP kinase [Dehalococcoidia bacterium]